ncbi:hypothetical protein RRG08_003087 [Elysia crispata]|uniref:Uncharacterized protein n=1 Tax=Elysia crispata TaxID=231223 RepID=A0AAE1B891_9GAST|nr:hypothetical protein RRG08_003087 [Elysia crispata]
MEASSVPSGAADAIPHCFPSTRSTESDNNCRALMIRLIRQIRQIHQGHAAPASSQSHPNIALVWPLHPPL